MLNINNVRHFSPPSPQKLALPRGNSIGCHIMRKPLQATILLAIIVPSTASPGEKILDVGPTPTPPQIDGRLDDACWDTATLFSGFVDINGAWPAEQTTVYVTYDDTNFYIGYRCNEQDMALLQASATNDDAVAILTDDDAFEFFLDINDDRRDYHQFGVNSLGARFDASQSDSSLDDGWDAEWEVKTSMAADHWLAEIRMPFASLGTHSPKSGDTWGANFNRGRRAGSEGEYSSWAALAHGFHRPEAFGTIRFGQPAALSYSVLSLGNPKSPTLRVLLRNGTADELDGELSWTVSPSWAPTITRDVGATIRPVADQEISISYPLPRRELNDTPLGPADNLAATLGVRIASSGEIVDEKAASIEWGKGRAMDLALDRYYYTPDAQVAAIALTRTKKEGATGRIEIRESMTGPPLLSRAVPLDQNEGTARMRIGDLDPGRYIVAGHLLDEQGSTLHSIFRVFIKREIPPATDPPRSKATTIRDDGILIRNGKPFCPFMGLSNQESPLGQDCFNVRYGRGGLVARPLDRPKLGLPWITTEDGKYFIVMPEEERMYRSIKGAVENRINDPSLLCFLTKVEAWIPMYRGEDRRPIDNVEELTKIRRFIKQIDPDRLTSIQLDQAHQVPNFTGTADIIEIAYKSSSFALRMIPNMIRDLQDIRAVLKDGQPFFFWMGSSIPKPEYRVAEDIRCGTYLALMHGAAGIVFHIGHNGIPLEDTRHWSVYPGLSREVEQVFSILATEQTKPLPRISVSPESIEHRVRRMSGKTYVVAVNTSDHLVEARISSGEDEIIAERVFLPLENRSLASDGKVFEDVFTAYEPHVYEL